MNTKTTEVESKIPDITNLAIKTGSSRKVTEIENKIPDTIGSIIIPEFDRLMKIHFDARMKQPTKRLASKSQVDTALDTADKNRKNKKNFKHLI